MCRSTAAPLIAMAGMAGTAVGIAIAVIRERADAKADVKAAQEAAEEAEALDASSTPKLPQADEEDRTAETTGES